MSEMAPEGNTAVRVGYLSLDATTMPGDTSGAVFTESGFWLHEGLTDEARSGLLLALAEILEQRVIPLLRHQAEHPEEDFDA